VEPLRYDWRFARARFASARMRSGSGLRIRSAWRLTMKKKLRSDQYLPASSGRISSMVAARFRDSERQSWTYGRLSFATGFRSPFSASSYAAHSTPYAAIRPSGRGWLSATSKRFVYAWSPSSSRSKA